MEPLLIHLVPMLPDNENMPSMYCCCTCQFECDRTLEAELIHQLIQLLRVIVALCLNL